ncbi:hypothetical protein AWB69_01549 [Caballeronia udeis]|uniref:Uncharacterized protein n=1 Tax=Caballeronia udeis TaxID=1232866 RepID=A0A158FSA4_9BURK|nr:hypothetical protein AWB69_01549 [Caballeronia udeis]
MSAWPLSRCRKRARWDKRAPAWAARRTTTAPPSNAGAKRKTRRTRRYLRLALMVSLVPSLSVTFFSAPPVGIVKWTSWLKKLSVGH